MSTAEWVTVFEVGPRDGLQNEARILSSAAKLDLIRALVKAGLTHIEATSFVSPKWIPALADAEEVVRGLPVAEGLTFSALVPNARGLERARAGGLCEVAVFLSASETHNRRNTNRTIRESLDVYRGLIAAGRESGLRVRAYVSTVWGCPYEGIVEPRGVLEVVRELIEFGAYQVSLGDTIGVGTPRQTREILALLLAEFSPDRLALHMHDTRGTALANVLAGLDSGIRTFDAAIGGLGGCPYAPGASGNVATEDLVYMLHGMGLTTGTDLGCLIEAAQLAESLLGRTLPGKVHQAGIPTPRATENS